ncbi:hypothetical protein ZHAS_00018993 [Anopheles sinensis]|uniref:Uncharacterized protein n=1 Tax=Anopheles sinensis TaxID=74873 RepID=A0A084WL58_ANOSI|nr:hypothetical protein ZHAS_00018993 [Anopheles sinensis]
MCRGRQAIQSNQLRSLGGINIGLAVTTNTWRASGDGFFQVMALRECETTFPLLVQCETATNCNWNCLTGH